MSVESGAEVLNRRFAGPNCHGMAFVVAEDNERLRLTDCG